MQACLTKACHQDAETLRVLIGPTKCIGCQSCVNACPFGHAHYDGIARVSAKCDCCDGEPECARVCEPGAISYVYSDENSQLKKREAAMVQASLRRSMGPQPTNGAGTRATDGAGSAVPLADRGELTDERATVG
jgi:Fe-S-cluster-containing dehydrogenase component